jgi:2',3'-cyclic-nucleotide 2'-phosphodiesterase (5'-nucleotidase family)
LNSGSIRDSIAAGDVTKGQLLSVLPYGNYVYTVEITGRDIADALNHGLGQPGAGAFPQFWGMEVVAKAKELVGADGSRSEAYEVESATIGGKPLDPDAKYKFAINDFLYSGGDGYTMFAKYDYSEFATLEEVFRNFVTAGDPSALRAISDAEVLK